MKSIDIETDDRLSLVNGGKTRTSKARPLCILATGLVFLSIGTFIGLFVPKYIHDKMIDDSVVCDTNDPDYEGWLSNVDSKVAGYRDWYVYDVTNAGDVMEGLSKPIVHEKGPWVHRCYSTKYKVKFEGATVSWKSFMNCAFEADNERNCEDCDNTTEQITFMNPGYGQVLKSAFNEGMIFLQAAGCSTEQIMAIGDIGNPFNSDDTTNLDEDGVQKVLACDWSTGAPRTPGSGGAADNTKTAASLAYAAMNSRCGCCIPDKMDPTLGAVTAEMAIAGMEMEGYYVNGAFFIEGADAKTAQLTYGQCKNIANAQGPVADKLSMLAKWDGGIQTEYNSTTTPNLPIYSEVMVKKSVNELAYGFPSAFLGYFLSKKLLDAANATASVTPGPTGDIELTKMIFLGQVPAVSGYTLGKYTSDVSKVCMATCDLPEGYNPFANPTDTTMFYASSCGRAPEAKDLDDDVKYLAGIDCSPFTGTWIANALCIWAGMGADRLAGGTGANYETYINNGGLCKCAMGSPGTNPLVGDNFGATVDMAKVATEKLEFGGTMCCMGGGVMPGDVAMEGTGCLAASPGFLVSDRNIFTEAEADAFSKTLPPNADGTPNAATQDNKVNTGCDITKDEGENVLDMLEYAEESDYDVWKPVTGGAKFPTVTDMLEFESGLHPATVSEKVEGKNGGIQIEATGLKTRKWASKRFNDGKPSEESFQVYVSQLNRAVEVSTETTVELEGVILQRYIPSKSLLAASDANELQGLGITAGLAVGTYAYGLPILFGQPNFLYGDPSLFTDIDLYATYNVADGTKLDPPVKMNAEYVKGLAEHFELKLDIDPSTGKAMEGHNRLMAAFYAMKCDPTLKDSADELRQPDCALFAQLSQTSNVVPGYPNSVANVFTPKMSADVAIPTFWMDENARATDSMLKEYVGMAEKMQYADAVAIVLGFIGFTMIVFGIFGCLCGKRDV